MMETATQTIGITTLNAAAAAAATITIDTNTTDHKKYTEYLEVKICPRLVL